ncbi:MAG: GatB/YqeY domain-containing protein [Nitrospinaceae bacterium]|nr:GatB/YqeY domain-containing protein [Nitrospinaceae bacterium]
MSLKEKLLSNMKEAMKSKDSVKLGTVRGVISAVKNQEIDLKKDLSEEEILTIVSREVKKRKEAAVLYEKGNRPELKDKEIQEMKILQTYLPEQVSEKDLRRRIQEVIAETGAEGMKDFGKIMKTLVPEFKGKADNSLIKELANEYLN